MSFHGNTLGAGGENRTLTGLPPPDFESGASASSTTPARCVHIDFKAFLIILSNTLGVCVSFERLSSINVEESGTQVMYRQSFNCYFPRPLRSIPRTG